MNKYVALSITQTDCLYGFSTILVDTDDENIATINRLVETFNKVKALDDGIGSVTYFDSPIRFTVMNDELEGVENDNDDEPILVDISDEDFEKYSDVSKNEYRLESPIIRVSDMSIQIVYNSKWTDDEVYATLPIGIVEKLLLAGVK